MKISVFGLGYVGAVSLACLARDGNDIIGVDVDPAKLKLIQDGKTPVVEEGMVDLMRSVCQSGKVTATTDVNQAVMGSEISFICVGTPSARNGSQDLTAIERISTQLGEAIKNKSEPHVVVFRSTVIPGTTEGVVREKLEAASEKTDGKDFYLCFQPEFLREGSSIRDYDNPPLTVIGSNSEFASSTLKRLFGHLPCEFVETSIRTAETMKYCSNNFHAVKITFANEMARLCDAYGVNPFEVMELMCRDTQLNISPAYLKPGFAFGGSCLPKDLRATAYLAKVNDVQLPMLESVLVSNREHIEQAIAKVLESGAKRVTMLGLSFKPGTDDLRESPMVTLAEALIGKGIELSIFDPGVKLSWLLGANRKFISDHLPHIGKLLIDDAEEAISKASYLIAGSSDPTIVSALQEFAKPDQQVLDLVRIPGREAIEATIDGLSWD